MIEVSAARLAMGTRFEILLYGKDPILLRAAAEEALGEIERLDKQLSAFNEQSDVYRLNRCATEKPVQIDPTLFSFLERLQSLSASTGGAFDITVGPLMHLWGFRGNDFTPPDEAQIAAALSRVGSDKLILDAKRQTLFFSVPGMQLDLGAAGKGWAVDRALAILKEAGIEHALIHGGTSTVYALGKRGGETTWKIAIQNPLAEGKSSGLTAGTAKDHLAYVELSDMALSVSSLTGRFVQTGERMRGHVIDPRNGEALAEHLLAAVSSSSALESDALSTALLVLGKEGESLLQKLRPGISGLFVRAAEAKQSEPVLMKFGPVFEG